MPTFDLFHRERTEVILSWLFPATYLIHITEDYWAGVALSTSPVKIRGANLTPTEFLIVNGFAWILLVLGTILAQRLKFRPWLLISLATAVIVNSIFHLRGAIRISAYNPGLISGVLVWIPLGLITLIAMKKKMQPRKYWIALILGLGINGSVLLLARFGRRLFER